jgi:hypothetical protein
MGARPLPAKTKGPANAPLLHPLPRRPPIILAGTALLRGSTATTGFVLGFPCGSARDENRPASFARGRTTQMLIWRAFTGATGLEPASSGVTRRRSACRLGPRWWALSYWRTGCRVLGKVLGEPTGWLGNPLVKPNSGHASAEIAPRRSPVRVRLAPWKPPQTGGFLVERQRLATSRRSGA